MKKIISKIKSNKIILIILLAFVLNIVGIFYAYPMLHLIGDETAIAGTVLKMINDFSLRPDFNDNYYLAPISYIYLPFYLIYFAIFFLLGIVHSVPELRELILLDYADFKIILPLARFISVLAGCLSVYLVYKISQVLFKNNKSVSLWGAFFTATSLMFVQLSHFSRIWIFQTLAILLAVYYLSILLSKKKNDLKHYLVSAGLIALSFGIHLVGGIVYFYFLFVHYFKNKDKGFIKIFFKSRNFWLTNLFIFIIIIFIIFLHPQGFNHYFNLSKNYIAFGQEMGDQVQNNLLVSYDNINNLNNSLFDNLLFFVKILLEYEFLLFLLFLISLPILFLKNRKIFHLLFSFIIIYYLFVGVILKVNNARYILPIIPFLAIIAGYGFSYFLQFLSSKYMKNALVFIFCLSFLFMPFYWNFSLLKPNTFVLAKKWVETNLSSGERIINFELDNRLVLNENKESLILFSETMPNTISARERYLLTLEEENYPYPNYFIIYRPEKMPEGFLSQNQFNYLIIYWWNEKEENIVDEKIAKLNYDLELVQNFYPNEEKKDLTDLVNDMRKPLQLLRNIKYTGPYIEIYKIIN